MSKRLKKILLILLIVVVLIVLTMMYLAKSSSPNAIEPNKLPKYELEECVIHNNKEGKVNKIADRKTVFTDEYLYQIRYKDSSVSKLIVESRLKECN